MRVSTVFAAATLTALFSEGAAADFSNTMTADRLLNYCNHADPKTVSGDSNAGICFGYISGIVNAFDMLESVCVPRNTPEGQPTLFVVKFLAAHPEMKGWLAPLAVLRAAQAAYPCAAKPKP